MSAPELVEVGGRTLALVPGAPHEGRRTAVDRFGRRLSVPVDRLAVCPRVAPAVFVMTEEQASGWRRAVAELGPPRSGVDDGKV